MQYSKNSLEEVGVNFPDQIINFLKENIEKYFKEEHSSSGYSVQILGKIYENEIVCLFNLFKDKNTFENSLGTFSISHSFKDTYSKDVINCFLEIFLNFLEEYNLKLDGLYSAHWSKETYKNKDFYLKASRENLILSLQADEILKNHKSG